MLVYRIQKTQHTDPLDLTGARLVDGRWHCAQYPLIYTADSPALAAHEIEVHYQQTVLLLKWILWEIEVDDDALEHFDQQTLPQHWRTTKLKTRDFGSTWVQSQQSVALVVPSAIIQGCNVLLNMTHPDAKNSIHIRKAMTHDFDTRKWVNRTTTQK